MKDRLVLDGRDDDMVASLPGGQGQSLEGEIIGLGSGGGEIDLLRRGVEQAGDALPGFIEPGQGGLARGMKALGVAESLPQKRLHRLPHPGVERRGRDVVEIDLAH
jgi:hypothetical protein